MKRFSKISTTILLTLLVVTGLTGCSKSKDKNDIAYVTPVEGWRDIGLPKGSAWQKSNISGKVENHYFDIAVSASEFMVLVERTMESNEWTLSKTVEGSRNFIKDDNQVEITVTGSAETDGKEAKTTFLVLIEPKNAYGPQPTEEETE